MRLRMGKVQAPGDEPVTMLELFFDLVFVFVITQITTLITASDGWTGYGHAALVLLVTWWMYDGFAWLANNVLPTATRLPMLLAMTCFLAMAAVVPDVFDTGAWIFGVSVQGSLGRPLVLGAFVLAMVLISALWWVYFGTGDDERGLHAVEAAPADRRAGLCLRAFGHDHLLHITGLVLVAAGLHEIVHDPAHHPSWAFAITCSGGVAAFLLGQAGFRRTLGTGPVGVLLTGALLAVALAPLGVLVAGFAQLVGLAVAAAGAAALMVRQHSPVAA